MKMAEAGRYKAHVLHRMAWKSLARVVDMTTGQRDRWLAGFASMMLLVGACGDDSKDDAADGGNVTSDGGAGTMMDGGADGGVKMDSGARPMVKPAKLADNVAGKACSKADDCAGDRTMCLTDFNVSGPLASLTGGTPDTIAAPGGYCTISCMSDAECGKGGHCFGDANIMGMAIPGTCQADCTKDTDCRTGYHCAGAAAFTLPAGDGGIPFAFDAGAGGANPLTPDAPGCAPIPTTAKLEEGIVGKECAAATECKAGGECLTVSAASGPLPIPGPAYQGGFCTGDCLVDADCGSHGRCLLSPGSQAAGTCQLACAGDSNCRAGYRCRDQGAFKGCVPGDVPVPAGVVGTACASTDAGVSAECGGAKCLSDLSSPLASFTGGSGTPLPGGYCSAACVDAQADCGGGLCLGAFSFPGVFSLDGFCYKSCAANEDCRAGYECSEFVDPLIMLMGGGAAAPPGPKVCQAKAK
jgi:hypothetical protein